MPLPSRDFTLFDTVEVQAVDRHRLFGHERLFDPSLTNMREPEVHERDFFVRAVALRALDTRIEDERRILDHLRLELSIHRRSPHIWLGSQLSTAMHISNWCEVRLQRLFPEVRRLARSHDGAPEVTDLESCQIALDWLEERGWAPDEPTFTPAGGYLLSRVIEIRRRMEIRGTLHVDRALPEPVTVRVMLTGLEQREIA